MEGFLYYLATPTLLVKWEHSLTATPKGSSCVILVSKNLSSKLWDGVASIGVEVVQGSRLQRPVLKRSGEIQLLVLSSRFSVLTGAEGFVVCNSCGKNLSSKGGTELLQSAVEVVHSSCLQRQF
jgi:hypothetical protein